MEQEKQSDAGKHTDSKQYILYGLLFVVMLLVLFLCIKICILEEELDESRNQIEQMKLTLELEQGADVDESDAETLPGLQEGLSPGSASAEKKEEFSDFEIQNAKHKVYLTFDDGPSANTEAILDILDEYNVKATFFVLGKEDETSKKRLQMIYERGHTIGMHSYSHVYSDIYFSLDNFKADFLKSKQYLLDNIGADCMYYRFPGGSSNTAATVNMQECVDFLNEQGVEYYDWNVISGDGSSRILSKEEIVKNSTGMIQNYGTSIILMHDAASKKETVEALPEIIETIMAMDGAVILPITEDTKPVHHVISKPAGTGGVQNTGKAENQADEQPAVTENEPIAEQNIEQTTGEQ